MRLYHIQISRKDVLIYEQVVQAMDLREAMFRAQNLLLVPPEDKILETPGLRLVILALEGEV